MFRTIALGIITILAIIAAIVQTKDGSLSRLLGRGAFSEGENLFSFPAEKAGLLMIKSGDINAQFRKNEQGVWWGVSPWNDRMDPRAAESILRFSLGTKVVDTLPLNNTVKSNLREFGVTNSPTEIVVKDSREHSLARYKLGNLSPWIILNNDETTTQKNSLTLSKKFSPANLYLLRYTGLLPILKDSVKNNYTPTTYLQTSFYQWMDDDIFVVTGNIAPLFKDGLRYLRDHRPLYISPDAIKNIEIKTDSETLTVSRKSVETPWQLTAPNLLKGDQAYITNLLGVLQQITALQVYEQDEITIREKNSPQNKRITISFFSDAPPVTLTIYPQEKQTDSFVLATVSDRNAVFKLPVIPIENMPGTRNLALTQKLLRAKNLTDLDRVKLSAIALRTPEAFTGIVVRKIKNKWLYSENESEFKTLNEEQLFDLLKTVSLDPVADFATDNAVDLSTYGLDTPRHIIMFAFEEGSPITIYIGRGIDGQFYAMVGDIPSVYTLSSDYVSRLGLRPHQWRPKSLQFIGNADLKQIIAEVPGSERLVLTGDRKNEKWEATIDGQKPPAPLNINKLNIFLDKFFQMEVRLWLPGTTKSAIKALENPSFKISFVTEKNFFITGETGTITYNIALSPATQGANSPFYYGQIEGDNDFFLIGEDQLPLFIPDVFETEEDDR